MKALTLFYKFQENMTPTYTHSEFLYFLIEIKCSLIEKVPQLALTQEIIHIGLATFGLY